MFFLNMAAAYRCRRTACRQGSGGSSWSDGRQQRRRRWRQVLPGGEQDRNADGYCGARGIMEGGCQPPCCSPGRKPNAGGVHTGVAGSPHCLIVGSVVEALDWRSMDALEAQTGPCKSAFVHPVEHLLQGRDRALLAFTRTIHFS